MGRGKEAIGAKQVIDQGAGGGGLDAGPDYRQSSHFQAPLQPLHDSRSSSEKGFAVGDSQKHQETCRVVQPASQFRRRSIMQYPICIEWGDENTAIGIQIPDIPGAVTAGDSFEDAYNAAVEVAHILLQEIAADGESIPMPTSASAHRSNPDFADMGWGMLELDISPYLGKTEKVNVTLPGYVIQRIDRYVREHNVKSRSSFLADAAMEKLVRY
jgi:predicted RNase H-like HicB family nuclease